MVSPRTLSKEPREAGIGSGGMQETAPGYCRGAYSPLRGSIFYSHVGFHASHPAKPRRASEDLFSVS